MNDIVDLYRRAVGEFDRRVELIGDDQWNNPTPCTEWNVRDLVNHITVEDLWVPPLLDGQTLEEVGDRFDGDQLGEHPKQAWAEARDTARQAVEAADLDGSVHTSMGMMATTEYLGQIFSDHLVHAWDLARGIGADDRLDPELVGAADAMLRPQAEMLRASGVFGDEVEVDDDADSQTRLLALLGRRA